MEKTTKTILVVDDENDVRNYLSKALTDAGFIVVTASDGFEALEKLKEVTPDLISLDLVMPKHSGLKFYRDIHLNNEYKKIPILIVTGHARDDLGKIDFDAMMMQGPGIYLEKPVKPFKYIETVCKMLGLEPNQYLKHIEKPDADTLRDQLQKSLDSADVDSLQKALEALRKKSDH